MTLLSFPHGGLLTGASSASTYEVMSPRVYLNFTLDLLRQQSLVGTGNQLKDVGISRALVLTVFGLRERPRARRQNRGKLTGRSRRKCYLSVSQSNDLEDSDSKMWFWGSSLMV